jgi:hypothetical protein
VKWLGCGQVTSAVCYTEHNLLLIESNRNLRSKALGEAMHGDINGIELASKQVYYNSPLIAASLPTHNTV